MLFSEQALLAALALSLLPGCNGNETGSGVAKIEVAAIEWADSACGCASESCADEHHRLMAKLQQKFRSEIEAIRAEGDRSKAKATDQAYRRGQNCLSRFDPKER